MSISIKLMSVPEPSFSTDEKFTQDMFGVSTPTFVTAGYQGERAAANRERQNAQIFYFLNFHRPHVLDLHHAVAVDKDADEPPGGPVLQLRPTTFSARGKRCNILFGQRRTNERRYRASLPSPGRLPHGGDADRAEATGTSTLIFGVQLQTDPI